MENMANGSVIAQIKRANVFAHHRRRLNVTKQSWLGNNPDINGIEVMNLLRWYKKAKEAGTVPVVVMKEPSNKKDRLVKFTQAWMGKKSPNKLDIAEAIDEFIECFADASTTDALQIIRLAKQYHVPRYGITGPVSGKNRYDADRSRIDGRLYKRGRR
jgi:hypothetical protein